MRLTQKRNGKNVIPLLMAVCGINLPYWRIDKADDLHSYLSGAAADKLAAYEDAEEEGRLVILPCKVGDAAWFYLYEDRCGVRKGIYQGVITELKSVQRLNQLPLVLAVVEFEYPDPWYSYQKLSKSEMYCSYGKYGGWVRFYLTREEAEAALKGKNADV